MRGTAQTLIDPTIDPFLRTRYRKNETWEVYSIVVATDASGYCEKPAAISRKLATRQPCSRANCAASSRRANASMLGEQRSYCNSACCLSVSNIVLFVAQVFTSLPSTR